MKKSIFLFFAAILCAMSANAQLYLRGGFNDWNNLTADYQFVGNVCNLELPGGTTYEFKIADSSWGTNFGGDHTFTATATKTLTSGGGNMNITTTIPGTYKFEFVQSTKTLTVTYPEVPAPHDITVRAKLPATWTSSTITAWVWTSENASGTPVTAEKDGDYYKITKNAGALYVIFRNGADWNGDKNQTVDLVYTEDVCLQLNQSGTAKATATVIDCGAVSKDITVKAVVPGAWEETITAWVWPTGGEGKEVTPTKDGNWYVVTENCIELNVIFKNGTGWNGNENQTVNIEGVSENICYQISALTKVDGKCSVTEVDCDAVIEPEAKPEPTPTYDYYITGSFNGWNEKDPAHGMTLDGEVYKATVTLAAGENLVKVTNGTWAGAKGYGAMGAEYDEVSQGASDDNIQVDLTEGKEVVVVYNATTEKVTFEGLTEKAPAPTFDYYITGSFNGNNPKKAENGMTLDGTVYKATVTLAAGDNTLKVTDGTWEKTWGANELGAAYEEVSNPNDGYNNIKITLAAEKEITVIFDATAGKITFEGLTEEVVTPAEDVTVYFINSGEWAEVACYYWGGTDASTWPGVEMTANGEVFEAEGWNVYKVTFPGDNTSCIFNDNKAEGATQTGNLEVHDGQYYCYENGIWYERLADVDPLDTRIYLKGQMNDWCAEYCDMFRKETIDGTVAYRTLYLEEANTTYEFKIEDAGAWLSNTGTMTKDNCTDWTFEESVNDNAKFTTEYAGDYTFIWDMTTNKLSVVYPDPKANPSVLDLMVTNMEFDGETFSGTDNEYGIVFNLVVGEAIEEGVFALDASSTVDFGGTLFTEVTGMIAPDMNTFASATAQVLGFLDGMYFQLNVEMSAGGSAATLVEIWDGVATPNDGTGELTISANWDGDDVYVFVPGFDYINYECPEVWFYIGGTTWETASIAAYGPATITVEDGGVLVEGTVISGITGTQYELMVFGLLPVEETPDYTRTVASGSYGTICLPSGSSKVEGAKFYEVTYKKDGYIYADEVTTLVAGMPYIFHATSTEIKVYYNETTATAGSNNGVYGTFSDITDGDAGTTGNVLEGKYLLVAGPKVQKCGGNCSLAANRAYFVVDEITTQEKQEIPGRQRIALGCQDENQATGLDNITENGIVAPALQGTYDILGRQLSEPAANGFYIINGKKMFVAK